MARCEPIRVTVELGDDTSDAIRRIVREEIDRRFPLTPAEVAQVALDAEACRRARAQQRRFAWCRHYGRTHDWGDWHKVDPGMFGRVCLMCGDQERSPAGNPGMPHA